MTALDNWLAAAAGVEGASGHSCRFGSAQSLIERGASTAAVAIAGRWKDPGMVVRYAKAQEAGRGAVKAYFGAGRVGGRDFPARWQLAVDLVAVGITRIAPAESPAAVPLAVYIRALLPYPIGIAGGPIAVPFAVHEGAFFHVSACVSQGPVAVWLAVHVRAFLDAAVGVSVGPVAVLPVVPQFART